MWNTPEGTSLSVNYEMKNFTLPDGNKAIYLFDTEFSNASELNSLCYRGGYSVSKPLFLTTGLIICGRALRCFS